MLTIFTIPKPFEEGHIATIQHNALASWRRLGDNVQMLVFGDDPGVAEAAREHGAEHVPRIRCTRWNTPLLSDAFRIAHERAHHETLVYLNCDIVPTASLPAALADVSLDRFLMVARRWDLDVVEPLDFEASDWEAALVGRAHAEGSLHGVTGMDLLAFKRRSGYATLPDFAVGRPCWDNWMVFRAHEIGIPVIDATERVTLIHQNHGYGHVPQRTGPQWVGPEADRNQVLLGGAYREFTIADATHRLIGEGVVPRRARRSPAGWLMYWLAFHPRLSALERRLRGRAAAGMAFPSGDADGA